MLSLALALALTPNPFTDVVVQSTAPRDSASGQATSGVFIPYGEAVGTYTAPTLYANGNILALLEDASGKPLWVLQAEIMPSGNINGDLSLLKYGNNPASFLPALSVAGHAVLDAEGRGVFTATITTKSFGQVPVVPMGQIEGVLRLAEPQLAMPAFAGQSGLSAVAVSIKEANGQYSQLPPLLAPESGVLILIKGQDDELADSPSSVQSAGQYGQAGGASQDGAVVIFCPIGPSFTISDVQSVGQAGDGSIVAKGAEGDVFLRWWLN
jgi:hypothetical protein